MSDFQNQFDQNVAAANSRVAEHAGELNSLIPGLQAAQIRRLLTNISKMLGQVDRREAAHPEYLAGAPRSVPERAVELIASIAPSFDSGTPHFVQNVLPSIVDVERRLVEAIGSAAFNTQQIKNQQIKAIEKLTINAQAAYNRAHAAMTQADKSKDAAAEGLKEIQAALATSNSDHQKVAEIRRLAEKLSKGNASQNPIEALVRIARERSTEIDEITSKASQHRQAAQKSAENAEDYRARSADAFQGLEESDKRADEILRNATQAGLAGAYKTERDKLSGEQNRFALSFYGIILAIIVYAAIFLLPIFRDLAGLNGDADATVQDSALMLLVRLVILSPVVWALIFTNRRFRYLETLQMDYAAKTTTALAYSGYIDEMETDPELSRRLKDGLVLRFLEHPSRLLGKKQEVDVSSSGPEGVRVESRTATTASELEKELQDDE